MLTVALWLVVGRTFDVRAFVTTTGIETVIVLTYSTEQKILIRSNNNIEKKPTFYADIASVYLCMETVSDLRIR